MALDLKMGASTVAEFRASGNTVYATVNVEINRLDGVTVATDGRHAQISLEQYPEIAAHVAGLQTLIRDAYLFQAQVATDPLQQYIPPAPGGATVSIVGTDATLSWTAVSGATGYKVYRSTDGGATWSAAVDVATTSHTFSGASLDNLFGVSAVGSGGEGPKATVAPAE